jgi:hypothetical protein
METTTTTGSQLGMFICIEELFGLNLAWLCLVRCGGYVCVILIRFTKFD